MCYCERCCVKMNWSSKLINFDFQVLGDIEIAQGIERDKEKKQKEVNKFSTPSLSLSPPLVIVMMSLNL